MKDLDTTLEAYESFLANELTTAKNSAQNSRAADYGDYASYHEGLCAGLKMALACFRVKFAHDRIAEGDILCAYIARQRYRQAAEKVENAQKQCIEKDDEAETEPF
jgi:hypothetical protein